MRLVSEHGPELVNFRGGESILVAACGDRPPSFICKGEMFDPHPCVLAAGHAGGHSLKREMPRHCWDYFDGGRVALWPEFEGLEYDPYADPSFPGLGRGRR